MTQSLTISENCVSCGAHEFIESDGYNVCRECGTVNDRVMKPGSFLLHETENRHYMQSVELGNRMHIANAHGSHIGYRKGSESIFRASKILRMKRIQQWAMMRNEQRLQRGLLHLNNASVQLQLPRDTRDRAAYLFRKTLPHYSRGNYKILVVCILVLVVRLHQLPIREKEIVAVVPIPIRITKRQTITRTKFFVMKILDIKWPSLQPECFIPRLISGLRKNTCVLERLERRKGTLNYFNKLERLSTRLLRSMTYLDYGGRDPVGLAASLIYTIDSMLLHVTTQKTVGKSIGVPEQTVRGHSNKLWEKKKHLINKALEEVETQ